jgi:RimJ/RimL family protein N-acetyltransferase
VKIFQISPEEWAQVAEMTYQEVFEMERPKSLDRIDYALVAQDEESGRFLAFITCRELDSESVYWQYGGGFPGTRATVHALPTYLEAVKWTKARYKRITTLVESENVRYLKMAMAAGFRIIGTRTFKGTILVELLLDFEKGE